MQECRLQVARESRLGIVAVQTGGLSVTTAVKKAPSLSSRVRAVKNSGAWQDPLLLARSLVTEPFPTLGNMTLPSFHISTNFPTT